MGIPKGEGKARGPRAGSDRVPEAGKQASTTVHPAVNRQAGSIAPTLGVDPTTVIDAHGTAVEDDAAAGHGRLADVHRGSEGVMKSVDLEEAREVKSTSQTVLGSNELLGGSFANST